MPHSQIYLDEHHLTIKIDYSESGPENANTTLVLIHGNSSSKHVFDDQIARLSKKYRVLALSLPGHGHSTHASNSGLNSAEKESLAAKIYHPLTMITVVTKFLQMHNIKKAHLIGWSLGGHLAYGVAMQDPSLVASITSIGSPPVAFSTSGFKQGFSEWFVNELIPQWIKNPQYYAQEEAKAICASVGFHPTDHAAIADMQNTDPLMRKYLFSTLDENEKYMQSSSLNGEHFVKTTHLPLCLMIGETDVGISQNCITQYEGRFNHSLSQVHVIKKAPHAVFVHSPQIFFTRVDQFIQNAELAKAYPYCQYANNAPQDKNKKIAPHCSENKAKL